MQTLLAAGLSASLALASAAAYAEDDAGNHSGVYVGIAFGETLDVVDDGLNDDLELIDQSISLQIGYRFNNVLRTDLELEAVNQGFGTEGRLTANAYFDFAGPGAFASPYAGGGVGAATDGIGDSTNDAELTFHAELGAAFNINSRLALIPAYRFTYIDNDDDDNFFEEDNDDFHVIKLGLRASF